MTQPDVRPATAESSYSPHSDRDRAEPAVAVASEWSLAQRMFFRFGLIYVVLYTWPGPVSELPGAEPLSTPYAAFWRLVVPWFGAHVLHLANPVSIQPSGSGDKLFDWVQVLVMLLVAIAAAVIWTIAEGRRSHPKLFAAFQLYLRFTLASILFGYGFDKIFPNQFEPMSPMRLTQYVGEASPGGLAWFFLGFSVPYEIFAGAGETLAALLLLFRRTTTLGAIIGAAVMTNVFMLNMSYDIPVKQFSGHLLLMCATLVVCDAERLLNVFIRQRRADVRRYTELFTTPRAKRAAVIVGVLLGVWMIGARVWFEGGAYFKFGRGAPRGPLYGIFEVETVTKNGAVQPPLLSDSTRWRRLAVSTRGASVRFATDSVQRFRIRADSIARTVTFMVAPDTSKKTVLAYVFPDPDHLVLRGLILNDSVQMTFRRRAESSYLLVNRGFHWINETPYFR